MPRVNQLHTLIHPNNENRIPSNRLLGTTTAQALRLLGEAIQNPGQRIVVKDHSGTDKMLLDKIAGFIQKLDLQFIKLERRNNVCTIEFQLYADVPTEQEKDRCKRCPVDGK
jgi:hypothetical protein